MLKGLINILKKSLIDHSNKVSSARISSYIVLGSIVLSSVSMTVIEIINASILWDQNLPYTIPSEHIWVLGLLLSHHLGLLFTKSREYKGESVHKFKSKNDFVPKKEKEEKLECQGENCFNENCDCQQG